jgi:omega-hydroxy-beta-dihydromenaquinone-9 sulfotransferase
MSLGINTKSRADASARSAPAKPLKPLDRPIFITGLGRSGTTIIHTLLSTHPNANWLSLFCAKFPDRPYLNRWLMRGIDIPLVNIYLKRRFVPLENYEFWDFFYRGFFIPCRDLVASDVDLRTAKSIRQAFAQLLTAKRNRLLIKITGCPRISFLHAIFPDAKFIHVTRDGRAVAHSRMRTPFWVGWQGWRGLSLWPETMPPHYQQEWERHQYSFFALAGIEWKAHLDQMAELRRNYPHIDILEVKYEPFCANPIRQVQEIAEYCQLPWDAAFEARARRFYVESENRKWQAELTEEQQAVLEEVMAVQLAEQGYEVGRAAFRDRAVLAAEAGFDAVGSSLPR